MAKILAIDLGKFKSVTCLLKTETNETEFWTMSTDRQYLLTVLKNYDPDLVVIESCGLAGWVHDVCTEEGYQLLVCNPNQEAWKWKNVKRKTDRDDALKLAKLAALGQLVPVYIPSKPQREYRRLVKYRQVLQGRMNRVQNSIRAIFVQRGMPMVRGQKAWALERFDLLAQYRQPLSECTLDGLWRGELDLELTELDQLPEVANDASNRMSETPIVSVKIQYAEATRMENNCHIFHALSNLLIRGQEYFGGIKNCLAAGHKTGFIERLQISSAWRGSDSQNA